MFKEKGNFLLIDMTYDHSQILFLANIRLFYYKWDRYRMDGYMYDLINFLALIRIFKLCVSASEVHKANLKSVLRYCGFSKQLYMVHSDCDDFVMQLCFF